MTSTIAQKSMLFFDFDTTFSYDPPIANRDLLYMVDGTSAFFLNGCTLHSTATGLRLTKGFLFLDNGTTFSCEGTNISESISFGDGIPANDLWSVKVYHPDTRSILQYGNPKPSVSTYDKPTFNEDKINTATIPTVRPSITVFEI